MALERILITGASRGIGRAIALRLGNRDRRLLLHGRDGLALTETAMIAQGQGAEVSTVLGDLSSPDNVRVLIEAAGTEPLQALICNAGLAVVKPVDQVTLEEWQQALQVNVTAPFLLMQQLLPLIPEGGAIINILSIGAKVGFPQWGVYCMTKFAIEGFTQSLREELRPKKIRMINIYPAATATDIWDAVPGEWPKEKMMPPEEVAEAVAFALARPAGVTVDGLSIGSVGGNL